MSEQPTLDNLSCMNTVAIHSFLRAVAGCDTNLYVPFLSMTSSLPADRQRRSEHFETGAARESSDLENSRSQWDAECARVFSLLFFISNFFFYIAPPRARVCWLCHLTWQSGFNHCIHYSARLLSGEGQSHATVSQTIIPGFWNASRYVCQSICS